MAQDPLHEPVFIVLVYSHLISKLTEKHLLYSVDIN